MNTTLPVCATCAHVITPSDISPCDVEGCPIPMPSVVPSPGREVIAGSFRQVEVMVADRVEVPVVPLCNDPIAVSQRAMAIELMRLKAPTFSRSAIPEEFEDVADYLLRLADIVDRHIAAVGVEVFANASVAIDVSVFRKPLRDALDGNATYECTREAEALRDDEREVRRVTDYREEVGEVRS